MSSKPLWMHQHITGMDGNHVPRKQVICQGRVGRVSPSVCAQWPDNVSGSRMHTEEQFEFLEGDASLKKLLFLRGPARIDCTDLAPESPLKFPRQPSLQALAKVQSYV